MSSYIMRYSVLYELNTLDACWIAVDVWSNSSRCRQESVYLHTDVMPIFMIIALDIVINLRFSINCSVVICSPTVLFSILREASSETYGPRVYFPSYKFPIYNISFLFNFFAILVSYLISLQSFTFRSINQKYQKYLLYHLSISIRSHFCE